MRTGEMQSARLGGAQEDLPCSCLTLGLSLQPGRVGVCGFCSPVLA